MYHSKVILCGVNTSKLKVLTEEEKKTFLFALEKEIDSADIVCAAVSAVVTMAEATINDVCGAKAKVRVKEEDARITLTLPASCDEEDAVQAVLAGMLITLCGIRDDYPDYIEVLEV